MADLSRYWNAGASATSKPKVPTTSTQRNMYNGYTLPSESYVSLDEADKKKIVDFITANGRVPLADEIKTVLGTVGSGAAEDGARITNQIKWANDFYTANKETFRANGVDLIEDIVPDSTSPYHWDESKLKTAGSKENDLYTNYLQSGEEAYRSGIAASQTAERDLQSSLAGQNKSLLDTIRSERRSKLKSGLSTAQIANEEMQYIMMAQQEAATQAKEYYLNRETIQNNYAQNPYTAYQNALTGVNAINTAGAGFAASDASSLTAQANAIRKQYNNTITYQQALDMATKTSTT